MSDTPEKPVKLTKRGVPRRTNATPDELARRARLHDSRVEEMARLMRELKYRPGVTTDAFAIEFDIPATYARELAAEASKRVREEYCNSDTVLAKVTVALNNVIDSALEAGDRHAIIKAVQVWALVTGAGAATKVQVQTDLTSMSPEQLRARKAEIVARLLSSDPADTITVAALPEKA